MKKILHYIFQESSILIICCVLLALYLVIFANINHIYFPHEQLSDLSKSLIMGHLHLDNPQINLGDLALYKNHYYVFYGIFPSILLIPFVLTVPFISQHILAIPVLLVSIFSLWKLGKHFHLQNTTTTYFVAAFIMGTPYFFLASVNITAYQVQMIATSLMLAALYFFVCKKNYFLTGLLLGFAGMTRVILLVGLLFFLINICLQKTTLQIKFKRFFVVLAPVLICIVLIFLYNFVRFENLSLNYDDLSINMKNTPLFYTAREQGTISPVHIPGNFFYAFLKTLDPIYENSINNILVFPFFKANESGMSLFLTSPFLVYLLLAKYKKKIVYTSIAITAIIALLDLSYYASGIWTYGYRYALDFLPFTFLILAASFQTHFDDKTKIFIIFSILFNAFFMYSIWNAYPFLPFLKLP